MGGVQHKDLIVAGQRNACVCVCVCVTVGRGREEFEFLHGDKRWPMVGREDEAQRGKESEKETDSSCFHPRLHANTLAHTALAFSKSTMTSLKNSAN